jgi:hypothetical protein
MSTTTPETYDPLITELPGALDLNDLTGNTTVTLPIGTVCIWTPPKPEQKYDSIFKMGTVSCTTPSKQQYNNLYISHETLLLYTGKVTISDLLTKTKGGRQKKNSTRQRRILQLKNRRSRRISRKRHH